jgi:hypothetical protein
MCPAHSPRGSAPVRQRFYRSAHCAHSGSARKKQIKTPHAQPRPTPMITAGWPISGGVPRVTLPIDESLRLRPIEGFHTTPIHTENAPAAEPPRDPVDFSDPESQRVLSAAALAVARELGRQAGREWFDQLVAQRTM